MASKSHYDLIVSLGANCSAAHNLRYRDMRPYSLPLDWVYMEDDKPIKWLINAFETKFSGFLQYENLEQLPPTNEHAIIYKDMVSGFVFPNHWVKEIKNKSDYDVVASKMHRRVKRLFDKLDSAKSVLFIIAANQELNTDNILMLYKRLIKQYPGKNIDFEVMLFSAKKETEQVIDNVHIRTFERPQNNYDFTKTNYEWMFLDDIQISNHPHKNKITIVSLKLFHRKYKMEISWKRK